MTTKLIVTPSFFSCRSLEVFIEKAKTEKCLVSGNQKLETFWPQTKTIWGFWFWDFAKLLSFPLPKTAHFSSFSYSVKAPKLLLKLDIPTENF